MQHRPPVPARSPAAHRAATPPRHRAFSISRTTRPQRTAIVIAALLAPFVLATPSSAVTQVTVRNPGGLTAAGPVNTDYGFPAWYQDSAGTRIEPCLDQADPLCGFLPGDVPDPSRAISFPDNFPDEFFYQLVGSDLTLPGGGKAVLTLGLEAAFANGVEAGEQVVFARTRVTVRGGPRNATLTFKHPFGELTVDTDGTGAGRIVQDISPAVGNFTAALKGNFGPFLKWDPAVAPAAPAGFAGDPARAHAVVGGLNGYNRFSVSGGGLAFENNQFTVSGRFATNTGVTGDAATVNQGYLDVFATSAGTQLQVDGVAGSYVTTPMTNDHGSNRHYARITYSGPKPSTVTVRNLGDKPANTAVITLPDTAVTKALYDGRELTVAVDSDRFPVTLSGGLGVLENNSPVSIPMLAPPATITFTSAGRATVTAPVTVTGGEATDPGLPPVAPAPDPGPVIDKTPDNPAGTPTPAPVAAIAAPAAVIAGATATLDGSPSTGNGATFTWTQVSGPAVALSNPRAAKPTFTVPFPTATNATAPAATTAPLTFRLVVTETPTDSSTARTSEATVTVPVKTDALAVAAGTRHRIGTEFRIDGTALVDGAPFSGTPGTSVVIWDVTRPAAPVKLGVSPVDTLGNWTLRLKPGPAAQITSVLVQSTRGGSATVAPATR